MKCPKCGSENCNAQIVTKTKLKTKHNWMYWLFIGWWLEPMLWLFLTIPKLLLTMFGHKKQKIVQKNETYFVCNNCGHTWK